MNKTEERMLKKIKELKQLEKQVTEHVNFSYLDRICEYLDCSLSDLMEYIPDEQKKTGAFLIVEEHGNQKGKSSK